MNTPLRYRVRSGWAFPAASLQPLAQALAPADVTLVDALDDTPPAPGVVDVGWSLGAITALQAALRKDASMPRGLVLIAGTARFTADAAYEHGQPAAAVLVMLRGLRTAADATLSDFYMRCAQPFPPLPSERPPPGDALREGLHRLLEADFRDRLTALHCPVLLLHGRCDMIVTAAASAWLAARLPQARRVEHPGSGHDLPLREPRWVAEQIVAFARSLP